MLKIRATLGEEGMWLLDAVGTGFEDIDDRCVREAAVFTVDADSQPVAWRGARDEEGGPAPKAESEATRDDPLDDCFRHIAGSSGKDDRGAALRSTSARCHALLPFWL